MDAYEATKVVFSRVQSLDPENASKIMGLLLIQDNGEKEMIRLAFGPENLLHYLVVKARQELGIPPNTRSNKISRQNSSSNPRLFLPNDAKIPTSLTIPTFVNPSHTSWGGGSVTSDLVSPRLSSNGCMSSNKGCGCGCPSTLNPSTPPFYSSSSRGGLGVGLGLDVGGGAELVDEVQLPEELSFLNDNYSPTHHRPKSSDLFYSQSELLGDGGVGESIMFNGVANAFTHRRSCSVSDINLGSYLDDPSNGLGWKPCMYYAKGFCNNGSSCRFVHRDECETGGGFVGSPGKLEMMEQCHQLLRSKSMQHHKLMASPGSPTFPYSINKGLSLFAQNDSPRAGMMMGEEFHKFSRSPRGLDSCHGDLSPASRQIYLTFPADSAFREEDVSNYFSIYGPVQDVRIPYQQKRMFGFVTFVCSDTVKIILAKGNPHFVCDSRVLVKPYKEKGKAPDKFRGEFSSFGSLTAVDSRDIFDPPIGGRMSYDTQTQYMLWKRKLEEEADLQQAIELQTRRLMGLQLLDVKRNHHYRSLSTGARSIHSPTQSPNSIFHQSLLGSDRSSPDASDENCVSPPLSEANQVLEQAINEVIDRENEGSIGGEDGVNVNCKESHCHEDNVFDFPESLELNLPDSPFASPEKAACVFMTTFPSSAVGGNSCEAEATSPFKPCYFQLPRFSPGPGAIGM